MLKESLTILIVKLVENDLLYLKRVYTLFNFKVGVSLLEISPLLLTLF